MRENTLKRDPTFNVNFLLLITASFILFGSTSIAQDPTDSVAAPTAEYGGALYARHCSHCHGFNLVSPGTVAFDLRQFPHDQKSRFINSVTYGKNNRMPPWGDILSAQDIESLWGYVLTGGK